ncbi:MAG: ABC transporter ATP-binding protein/permease [Clostridia bacterium]|nr:ABC transporter ATP-binding protein/permease [Clostridia bacterium]
MLKLAGIKKDYITGNTKVQALKGVDLSFRKSEFVSVLGQSGCGKTTLLNIIGGLDKYSSGDLFINGVSTKHFKDRDWDNYRNHSVGFVFQSYNLIPHQSVLQNVELALSLSGVSRKERKKRAKEALEKVGLGDQLKKKPSEMSGGQMQRVAIARAIVNNPDIILADEPTGALDTETSVQVMEILKEISKDRLVIMVTHNPELAEKYSTRIIRMLDGIVTSDSKPLSEEELKEFEPLEDKPSKKKREKMPSMSLATSFSLSLKNLFTKKGRTILTSFAGSIGIIGIALIFAVSQGMTSYIDMVQEDTLASYPITLENQSMDISSLLETFIGTAHSGKSHEKDAVYQKSMVYDMLNALNTAETNKNDLKSFKTYLENQLAKDSTNEELKTAINGVSYTYDFDLLVYTENIDGDIIRSDSEELMQEILLEHFGMDMTTIVDMQASTGMSGAMMPMGGMNLWQEMLSGENGELINPLIKKQYDMVYGSWPNDYNEIVLVLDENNELDDMALYSLGLKSKEEIDKLTQAAINQEEIKYESKSWSYEEICDNEFRVILNSDCYTLDEKTGIYTDLRDTKAGLKYLYDNGIELKVTGIIRPNEDAVSTMLTGSIAYTKDLTEYVVGKANNSVAIKAQKENPETDIFTKLPFSENSTNLTNEEKQQEFKKYLNSLDKSEKAETYVKIMCVPAKEDVEKFVSNTLKGMKREDIEKTLSPVLSAQTGMNENEMNSYLSSMKEDDLKEIFSSILEEQYKAEYAKGVMAQLSLMPSEQLSLALDNQKSSFTTEQCALYYDEVLEFSDSSYEANMRELGYVMLDTPSSINLYATTFEDKDIIEAAIAEYNDGVEELSKITYTDYVGIMMSSITTIINAITYVLIAFVAVSLVVSSIMIGVITLISVQERTKEIGILRAIGASKRNVSTMFNAETVIIGFTSGALGVIITYLLCIPINMILHHLTGIGNLNAILPLPVGIILVIISVLLTMLSGLIPSRSAAKKDPVIALRTE